MSAMVSRTLLVNPDEAQKQAYALCHGALETLLANLKPGQKISQAYNAARDFIQSKNSNLHFHTNFGFGIGFNYKEDPLMITESNTTLVKPGMTFHVRIALSGVHKEPARSVIAIGDTVVINNIG